MHGETLKYLNPIYVYNIPFLLIFFRYDMCVLSCVLNLSS